MLTQLSTDSEGNTRTVKSSLAQLLLPALVKGQANQALSQEYEFVMKLGMMRQLSVCKRNYA